MGKHKFRLNPALKKRYKITGSPVSNRFQDPVYGLIDFSEMTEQQAAALAGAKDFPYLEEIPGSD